MTNQEVIEQARGHIGTWTPGEDLDAAEAALDLRILEGMLMGYPAISRRLTRTRISAAHTLDENERVFNSTEIDKTITFPEAIDDPDDDEADASGDRPPVNGAVGAVSGDSYTVKLYVEMLGGWQQINGLTLTGTFPLGPEHELGASYMLACRLAPIYRATVDPMVLAMAEEARRHIDARFAQDMTAATEPGLQRRGWFDINTDI